MPMIVQLHEGVALKKFPLEDKPIFRIGRDPDSDIFIDDGVVSSDHAVIELKESSDPKKTPEYMIKDLGSTNKTYVNGETITSKILEHDDVIRIGWNNFKFIDETKKDPNKTAKIHKSWIPGVYYTKDDD
ncbi:MAG: FHA domain-containing protein [Deltaproteobacteria bacterium]|nr:FHA domain-containing protein [Deltaproteobacteria bacterium]